MYDKSKYNDYIDNKKNINSIFISFPLGFTNTNYDYKRFNDSHEVFIKIYNELYEYQQSIKKYTYIHGDTVMSNIIMDINEKPIFIDPRGSQENIITPYGDPMYDYAKLYQSLIGYDEILDDIIIDKKYKETMLSTFEKEFTNEEMKNIKIICKHLLFTLIPLHDNDKCKKYYELITRF